MKINDQRQSLVGIQLEDCEPGKAYELVKTGSPSINIGDIYLCAVTDRMVNLHTGSIRTYNQKDRYQLVEAEVIIKSKGDLTWIP